MCLANVMISGVTLLSNKEQRAELLTLPLTQTTSSFHTMGKYYAVDALVVK